MSQGIAMRQLRGWYGTALGQRVAAAEGAAIGQALAHVGVGDVVHVGPGPERLPLSPTVRLWRADEGKDLVLDPQQLPFRGQSLEALLLSHVLEFSPDPVAILEQAYQTLRPEGRLVVLSFNPLGLWGASRLWGRWRGAAAPWCGRQWTASVTGFRLQRAGFQALAVHFLCFRPPFQDQHLQERLDPWEDIGRYFGRLAAGIQMTIACRREPGMLDGPGLLEPMAQRFPIRGAQPAGRSEVCRQDSGGAD